MLADKILKRLLQLINHHCSLNLSQFTIFFSLILSREAKRVQPWQTQKPSSKLFKKLLNSNSRSNFKCWVEKQFVEPSASQKNNLHCLPRADSTNLRQTIFAAAVVVGSSCQLPLSRIKRRRTTARRWGTARWPFRWWWCRAVSGGWSSGPDCWPAETWNREQRMSNYHEFTE